jgi:two-component system LytT family response regulator
MMRALIVDDEPPARERLRRLLTDHPDVSVVAEAGDVAAAISHLVEDRIDVVFLDIHLPGGDGFDLLDLLGPRRRPTLICVTANAEHAVRAFDEAAIDYLLKPFSRERLADALARVREQRRSAAGPAVPRPRRIPVPGPTGTRFVEPRHITLVRGERNYVRLELADRTVLLRSTLRELEDRLPPADFVRVNRSLIVRLAAVVEVQSLPHGEVALRLTTGELVVSGRSYAPAVRSALGL